MNITVVNWSMDAGMVILNASYSAEMTIATVVMMPESMIAQFPLDFSRNL
jgi:hypothetical protein